MFSNIIKKFSKKTISLVLTSLIGFIDVMGIGLVYPMFASMLFQHDCLMLPADTTDAVRGTCLGILLATMPIAQFFSGPILGMLSDQYGRRKVLIPSLAVGVVGYLVAMAAVNMESLALLIFSRIAVGISAGTAAVVGAALADLSTSEDKAKNFGLLNMACGLGFTVGPFLGGVLSQYSFWFIEGYALPFAMAGTVTLINLLLVILFFEETFVTKTETTKLSLSSLSLGVRNIKKAFQLPQLQTIFLIVFIACFGWSFYWEFTPVTWINSYGFDTVTIGNFYAYGAIVYAVSCGLLIRPIVSRYSNQHILCYALAGTGFAIGMLLFHTDESWLWFYIPLQQFAIALFWPTAAAVISNSVGENIQGEILGVMHSIEALAFAVSPLIAGSLLGLSTLMPIVIGGACMLLAALILGIFLQKSDQKLYTN
jgi:DHA1 family tetracycline resistance protein-like MFS transporter